jgi:transposase
MARYGQEFKNKVIAKLLPPNTASLEEISREVGVSTATLERWRAESLTMPARERAWSASARLNAVITTAVMDKSSCSAWCRENGVYSQELEVWRASATQALAEPQEQRASPKETAADRKRIKELERELRRKDKALAETAALLVLSKKLEAIFQKGEDE